MPESDNGTPRFTRHKVKITDIDDNPKSKAVADYDEDEEFDDEDEEQIAPRDREAPLLSHLSELRKRLVWIVLSVFIISIASFPFMDKVIYFLALPSADNVNFIYTQPTGPIVLKFKLSIIAGVFLGIPITFYHITRFVVPALYKEERKWYFVSVISFFILFITGAFFCYYVLAPMIFEFMLEYGVTDEIQANYTPNLPDYINFLIYLIIGAGTLFQLPIVLAFLAKIGLVDGAKLKRWRPYAIIAILVLAAFLTPPDVISQIILAVPVLLLYEISIIIAKRISKKREQRYAEFMSDDEVEADEKE